MQFMKNDVIATLVCPSTNCCLNELFGIGTETEVGNPPLLEQELTQTDWGDSVTFADHENDVIATLVGPSSRRY